MNSNKSTKPGIMSDQPVVISIFQMLECTNLKSCIVLVNQQSFAATGECSRRIV